MNINEPAEKSFGHWRIVAEGTMKTRIFLDDKEVPYVRKIQYVGEAGELARLIIEVFPSSLFIDDEGEVEVVEKELA